MPLDDTHPKLGRGKDDLFDAGRRQHHRLAIDDWTPNLKLIPTPTTEIEALGLAGKEPKTVGANKPTA